MATHGAYAAPNWANSQRVGDVGTKATLMLLAAYADETFSCFPGQELIADQTEQSVRTVRRQLDLLEEVGLIRRESRYEFSESSGKRVRTSDRYFLRLDVTVSKVEVQAAQERINTGQSTRKAARTKAAAPSRESKNALPANLTGRSADDLPADLAGRGEGSADLAVTLTGRSVGGVPANLTGRSAQAPSGQNRRTYRPKSTHSPATSDRVTPRRTPRKTSTSERDVAAVDNSGKDIAYTAAAGQDVPAAERSVLQFPATSSDPAVDQDEVDRVLAHLPDRLQPSRTEARRLRGLVIQRMQLGWTREGILDAVEQGLRPGGQLKNPCGLFATTLVPLQAPTRGQTRQQSEMPLPLRDPWCGHCDEKTRYLLDANGYPDNAGPKCAKCAQLAFARHIQRGAS